MFLPTFYFMETQQTLTTDLECQSSSPGGAFAVVVSGFMLFETSTRDSRIVQKFSGL